MLTKELIHELPKVELHCHLDGSIQMSTLEKLAQREQLPLKNLSKAIAPKKCFDLKEYLTSFDIVLPLLQRAENLQLAAYDLVEQAANENICYLEIRFAPLLHQEKGLSVAQILEAVLQGIHLAQEHHSIYVNLIISGMRHHSEEENLALIQSVSALKETEIVGFDFAGDEQAITNQTLENCTQFAKESNLQLTLHSGECGCAQNVIEAIHLGATRIGHGVAIKDDPEAMIFCKEHQTLLEICPTSNIQTNAVQDWADYPFRLFLNNGVNCCINTDNRTVSQTNLTNEFDLLRQHFQLTTSEMMQLTYNALDGAFATHATKQILRKKIDAAYKTL
ncbi:MAG: adenosine deaminase [Enterococcus sp.]